jgi:glycosyltransferase involved in cell wall biosynthesis
MLLLDVLLPTRNRAQMLARAVESLLAAPVPAGLGVTVVVVNNGSSDCTAGYLDWIRARHKGRIRVVVERRCGKSRALNAGVAASTADLIGMIDDDEEIDPAWYHEILRAFTDEPSLDFVGGPYVPVWPETPPRWVPADYLAALGDVDAGAAPREFGRDFPGILKGGNAVIRRSTLLRVGPYAEYLGPAGPARLLSCEDEEMYFRLLEAGARGRYLPSLKIYHHVSAVRLTPGYFRRWCFWRGVSRGLMDRAHPMPVTYFAGVPRFLFGSASRGLSRLAASAIEGRPQSLSDELKVWDLSGYLWGRHIYTLARFSPMKSRRRLLRGSTQPTDTETVALPTEAWNPSCYADIRHGGEG